MGCSVGGETPAILQLRKWAASQFQFNLSEFREAFISPSRELLLLLSYQCEALLFPLITGDSVDCNIVENCYNDSLQEPCSSALSRSDSKDNTPSTSGSVMDFDNGFSLERNFSRSNNYPFVCDVNSLAWGVCGDTYNQHKDTSFRELLFVSDDQRVTVHAFCHSNDTSAMTGLAMGDNFGQGRWVEWGPSSTLVHNMEVEEPCSVSSDVRGNVGNEYVTNENSEISHSVREEAGDDESLRGVGSRRWLRSFFTKAETIKSDGHFWTRFPEKTSFPGSAKVVSFTIFDSNLPHLDVPAYGNTVSVQENKQETVLDPKKDLPTNSHLASSSLNFQSDVLPDFLGIGNNISFKCTRVFSRNTHDLVGFFLTSVDSLSVNFGDENERRSKNIIVVSRLSSWGIQWVSAVKLEDSLKSGSMFEWTDFCFSDDLLVCLGSCGLTFLYDAMSGNYVAKLDVLGTCGLNPCSNLPEQEKLSIDADIGLFGQRKFKKLIVASYTSLLAAIDEYGVIYVMCIGENIQEKYNASLKLFPHFSHLGLGMLFGWEAGGSDIGHQRAYSNFSDFHSHAFDISSETHGDTSFFVNVGSNILHKWQNQNLCGKGGQNDMWLSGFSAASNMNDQSFQDFKVKLHLTRRIFLPTDKYGEDDCICFSPLGITRLIKKHHFKEQKSCKIVHFDLHTDLAVHDDSFLNPGSDKISLQGRKEMPVGEAVGCTFQGCFYLVTEGGLYVVLPAVSVSSDFLPIETIGYRQLHFDTDIGSQGKSNLEMEQSKQPWSPWKVEILDRVIVHEGPEEADRLCLENGWDLKISRMRRLQMALEYLKFEETKLSLEMLVDVNLVEEGILRLLFAAVYLMSHTNGNDNEASTASRILAVATNFVTKMIRKYGLEQHKNDAYALHGFNGNGILSLPPILPDEEQNEMENCKRLSEMAYFLEIIRGLQSRLSAKFKKPGQGLEDGEEALSLVDPNVPQDESQPLIVSADGALLGTENQNELPLTLSTPVSSDAEKLALMPKDSLNSRARLEPEDSGEASALVSQGATLRRKVLPLENPEEMIARWKLDKLDLKTVVRDALLSGRLPLAVLQLHLQRSTEFAAEEEYHDSFTEVRDVGRAIAYELFLKGETGLAIATLQRLGEDIEICLKELVFGTVRRSLRMQIAEEMRRCGYVGPYEWKIMERVSLLERLYPSSSFWRTFLGRKKELARDMSTLNFAGEIYLHLLSSPSSTTLIIECGEVDGVVLGSWTNVNESSSNAPVVDENNAHFGYWAAAAVWSNAWDQRTIDRIVLDQPFLMGVHVMWESQLEYHMCHNDWEEVFKLLDVIPASVLSDGRLQIALDGSQTASAAGCNSELPDYGNYICSIEELDGACMDIPGIKIFRLSADVMCPIWLRILMEQELAKKFIFLKEYWEGTDEILTLLARSGFITSTNKLSPEDDYIENLSDLNLRSIVERSPVDAVQALHKLLVHYCAEHNLPNLLDLYLDHHKLVLDSDSLCSFQEAAGDCHWARWLLLSRIKGHEYEASFSNARSIMSPHLVAGSNLNVPEIDDIIRTVDDIAEGGGEIAALATLMYTPIPIQNCLCSGSVRHSSSSAQCTLENLRPALQRFPTLWRTLVAACFGEDTTCDFLGPKANNALSEYLNWRYNIFFSSGRDASLSQILPCWFPKAVKRLIQLYVQGPLGWQSLSGLPTESLLDRDIEFLVGDTGVSAISWEVTIQKHVEDELYDTSLRETGFGLEHLLHRGRALAAFNQLLGVRVEKLKSEGRSNSSVHGQANIQSDVQTLLAPLIKSEESLLSSVLPLAILHFEDSVLVTSCAFLLELCGLSASMLRVDVAALRRISSFYKSCENGESRKQLSPKGSAFRALPLEGDVTESLAQALADEYLHEDSATKAKQKGFPISDASARLSRALMLVLQHLEKASLPLMLEGKTCGCWLLTGNGDGTVLRSQQKAASQRWNLVTVFCQMHQLPLSTKYLAVLARDNDWVGFLYEAQVGGYPFETVVQVASKEFSDPRLKIHILTVLKGLQSRKKASSSLYSDATERSESSFLDENLYIPVELFRILANCEKQKNPGVALLIKAKELSWSVLAMIASCFPDVTPLSCLTVWLEITAARETSSIKVNDIASRIAENVAAAVEATKAMPASDRALTFHYNRRSPKRRRLMEPISADPLGASSDVSISHPSARIVVPEGATGEEGKLEVGQNINVQSNSFEGPVCLSNMVAVLCEQHLFLPLLRAFEMFLPSCSLLPFIRALQAFSQMRLSEASAHLGSFSARVNDEPTQVRENVGKGLNGTSWVSSTAVKAADAMLSTCPSPYEKRCLLQLLAATDFGDGGSAANYYRRLYWKINLAEPSLRKDDDLHLGKETLDDDSLLTALEKNGHWEQARNWAKQLDASGGPWKSTVHHVTETQAESLVAEWKEFLWDVPEERVALWVHCQTLFIRYSYPPLQAGLFFLKHAERLEKDLPARELHEMLLLSLQWLSGMISQSNPVYPLHLLREIETRVWLLAVESEARVKSEGDFILSSSSRENTSNIVDRTANLTTKMDNHINITRSRTIEKHDARENNQGNFKSQLWDASSSTTVAGNTKAKRRGKGFMPSRRQLLDSVDNKSTVPEDSCGTLNSRNDLQLQDESSTLELSFPKWEERVGPAELERAVLSLLEFGQIAAAKQLQHKLSPAHIPSEFILMDPALKLAAISTPSTEVSISSLDEEVLSVIRSYNILTDEHLINPLQVLETLATHIAEGCGRGLCKRIIAVVKAANVLGLPFLEAFGKKPVELLQLLSLKAQESFEEAHLLVQTHSMPAASIAQILAESFLKGLLAAHRGGYMDFQKEEGPAPLLWRFSDFLKWAELCPSEPEIGHALMRLVITGQEIPHACEVELLILSHHFYKSSSCLDGVDVLVALAATRVETYVSEGDFACLARLITGVGNFHALNFILGILIENGQLELLLQKYSAAADTNTGTAEAVRGFRMAVLTSLKHFNPNDLDAFAMVYNHFDMKHETASLLESRAEQSYQQWFYHVDKDQNEDLLESMRYFIEAAEVHSSIDAGNKTRRACAQASLVSLQIRMPDSKWLNLTETNARRALVEQSCFQEALIVAEAYDLNQPSEWALVLWNQMLKPELTEEFVAEFVAVLPLQPSMLLELAKFYRAEVAARGDQSQFSVWLTGGGLPAEWAKYLGRSFRCLLKRTRDVHLRLQLATVATGFSDVVDVCMKALDRVPENAGSLVLRRGHGGAYLPLM